MADKLTRAATSLDGLIRRLGRSSTPPARSWDVLAEAAGQKGPVAGYARSVLEMPRARLTLEGVDDFLRQQGSSIGAPLGRGTESMVFGVRGADGRDAGQVLKLQSPGAGEGFALPMGIEGVAGYSAQERFPTGLQAALQERARKVMSPGVRGRWGGLAEEGRWADMAHQVQRSLAARGMQWVDPHAGNVGVMRSGNMAAIDGAVRPMDAADAARIAMPIEDSIRLLLAPGKYR